MAPPTSRRRPRHSRRWVLRAVVVPLSAALILVVGASAAQLAISARDHTTDSKAPCTAATLATTVAGTPSGANYTQVRLSTIPAACNNLAISVVVYGAGGTSLATGTGNTGTTGTATIATASYAGASVVGTAVLIDTWGVKTTWTPPPTSLPTVSCIALNGGRNPHANRTCSVTISGSSGMYPNSIPPGGSLMNFTLNVTTTGAHWRVTVNFNAPFAWTPAWVGGYGNEVRKPAGYTCPAPMTTLQIEDNNAFWGTTLYVAQNGMPTYWGGQTICP